MTQARHWGAGASYLCSSIPCLHAQTNMRANKAKCRCAARLSNPNVAGTVASTLHATAAAPSGLVAAEGGLLVLAV